VTISVPRHPSWWRPLCLVVALGMPLAVLAAGCLNSPRVPADTGSGPIRRPVTVPRIEPASIIPLSWRPSKTAREWKSIVLHHTATEAGSVESIHANHLKRTTRGQPWLGIGYHFVIGNGKGMPDGAVKPTFRWRDQLHGAHAGHQAHNQHGIGIALIGHFDKHPPTPKQLASLRRLIAHLKTTHSIPAAGLLGHGDIKSTACPGKLFPLATLKREFRGGSVTP
jgi:hypothetical protein